MEELLKELQTDMEVELISELKDDSDKALLASKIKGAYFTVKRHRNYQEHHTEDFIDNDMRSMYDIIRELAMYDWNHIGAEGETSHSENGTSRTWNPRSNILADVTPFATIILKG
nr:MAG TPA: tail connector protein [Caudoviricetes sp.]